MGDPLSYLILSWCTILIQKALALTLDYHVRHTLPGAGNECLRTECLRLLMMMTGSSSPLSLHSNSCMLLAASHGHGCMRPHSLQRMSLISFRPDDMF